MDIKTLTGTSISDALAEARSLWGDDVVMLQAEPPSPGKRARIAVGLPGSTRGASHRSALAVAARETVPPLVHAEFSAGAASPTRLSPPSPEAPMKGTSTLDLLVSDAANLASGIPSTPRRATASEMLVTPPPGALRRPRRASGALLEKNIRPATEVFDYISRRKDPAEVAVPVEVEEADPTREPLFGQLIRQGIRPKRARNLAELSMESDVQAAVTALAGVLPPKVAGRAPKRVLFVGAAGAGKTSLVLRSAYSRIRAGRSAPTIIVVAPDPVNLRGWLDPTPLFEAFDLAVVRCSREALPSALNALEGEVLIDTPAGFPIPDDPSLHVRLVVDARPAQAATSREGDGADSVVITHVDQAPALGYLTERLIAMNIPVAALVRTGRPQGQIAAYDPETFAQTVCHV
ncbi:MAG: hypothetical protein HKN29_04810 [Rhodothermales bacterium]|nr:hypothetical protein [Rhodothermales bacterium]